MDNQSPSGSLNTLQSYSPPPSKSFKLPNKYLVIGIVVVVLVFLLLSSYFLVTRGKKEPVTSATPTIPVMLSPSPTIELKDRQVSALPSKVPTPTPNPVSDLLPTWSAYVTTKYGYSIKYPNNWTISNTAQADPKILEYLIFKPKDATPSSQLPITLSYTTRTYQEVLALDPQKGESITVATVSATKKTQKDSDGNVSINVIVPFRVNTIILVASEKYKDIFNQMLSTFKFL